MKEEDAQHAVTIDAPKAERLPLGEIEQSQDERKKQKQHASRA